MVKLSREIKNLIWAKACSRPSCIPKSRPRGKKAAGLRYERDLAKAVPGAIHGQWFEFTDSAGHGWCQPDLFFESHSAIWVLEAKYTWTEAGHRQIDRLYKPVLEKALDKPCFGMVVAKVLTSAMTVTSICRGLEEAMESARAGEKVCFHWLGVGLGPFQARHTGRPLASGLAHL